MNLAAYLRERRALLQSLVSDAQSRLDVLRGGLAEVEYALEQMDGMTGEPATVPPAPSEGE